MKTLYIHRHAKSSWANRNQRDFDRPLNDRGLRDIPFMAKKFVEREKSVDGLVSSPAKRAQTTAEIFAQELGKPITDIGLDNRIYEAQVTDLSSVVEALDDNWNSAVVFGHNPGLSSLVGYYSNEHVDMPTCAIAKLTFDIDSWQEAFAGTGFLEYLDFPKNYAELR
ncbi:SixA phosphatase family protein [Halocola ammonii]